MSFSNKAIRYQKTLLEIKLSAKEMQTHFYAVAGSRGDLGILARNLSNHSETIGHDLQCCKLGTRHTRRVLKKLPSLSFTNGVIKMKNNDTESIKAFEQAARACLFINDENNNEMKPHLSKI